MKPETFTLVMAAMEMKGSGWMEEQHTNTQRRGVRVQGCYWIVYKRQSASFMYFCKNKCREGLREAAWRQQNKWKQCQFFIRRLLSRLRARSQAWPPSEDCAAQKGWREMILWNICPSSPSPGAASCISVFLLISYLTLLINKHQKERVHCLLCSLPVYLQLCVQD